MNTGASYLATQDWVRYCHWLQPSPRKIQTLSLARQNETAGLATIGPFSSSWTAPRPTMFFASLRLIAKQSIAETQIKVVFHQT